MKFLRAPLLLSALLSACSPVNLLNATISTQGIEITKDVAYEPGPRHTMDIYRAAKSAGSLPVAVFFYGGSWQWGSKNDYTFVAAELARRGILVVVPDYRVYPETQYPGFIQDGAQAVAAIRGAALSWGGDPDRMFLVGHSAGAYIAAMLAFDPQYLAAAGDNSADLAGFVGISGPYDFLPIKENDIKAVFGAHVDDPLTQPINHVDGHNPPALLLQGDDDSTVYPRNTTALTKRITDAGGMVTTKMYPGIGHIGAVLGFAPLFRSKTSVLDDTANFITQTQAVKGRSAAMVR